MECLFLILFPMLHHWPCGTHGLRERICSNVWSVILNSESSSIDSLSAIASQALSSVSTRPAAWCNGILADRGQNWKQVWWVPWQDTREFWPRSEMIPWMSRKRSWVPSWCQPIRCNWMCALVPNNLLDSKNVHISTREELYFSVLIPTFTMFVESYPSFARSDELYKDKALAK